MSIREATEREINNITMMIELWNILFIVKENRLVPKEIEFFAWNVYLNYVNVDISSSRAVQFLSEKMGGRTGKAVVYTYRDKVKKKEWFEVDRYGIKLPSVFDLKVIPTLGQLLEYIQTHLK